MITKAKRRAKVSLSAQSMVIAEAIGNLRAARDSLRACGCKNAADYVSRAMKSADGAQRHARRRAQDEEDRKVRNLYEQTGDERLRSLL